MNYVNLPVDVLTGPEFLGCEPVDRATWLCLLRFCAQQENGGVIADCADWGERRWMTTAAVTVAEVHRECALWSWEGGALRVAFYPLEAERALQAKRSGAAKGGAARTAAKLAAARANGQLGGAARTAAKGAAARTNGHLGGRPTGLETQAETQAETQGSGGEPEASPEALPKVAGTGAGAESEAETGRETQAETEAATQADAAGAEAVTQRKERKGKGETPLTPLAGVLGSVLAPVVTEADEAAAQVYGAVFLGLRHRHMGSTLLPAVEQALAGARSAGVPSERQAELLLWLQGHHGEKGVPRLPGPEELVRVNGGLAGWFDRVADARERLAGARSAGPKRAGLLTGTEKMSYRDDGGKF